MKLTENVYAPMIKWLKGPHLMPGVFNEYSEGARGGAVEQKGGS